MSYISDTLRACEVMLERAARNGFAVQTTKGTLHGACAITRKQRAVHTREWLKERRRRIVEMYAAGWSATDIAARMDCHKSLVYAAVGTARPIVRLHP